MLTYLGEYMFTNQQAFLASIASFSRNPIAANYNCHDKLTIIKSGTFLNSNLSSDLIISTLNELYNKPIIKNIMDVVASEFQHGKNILFIPISSCEIDQRKDCDTFCGLAASWHPKYHLAYTIAEYNPKYSVAKSINAGTIAHEFTHHAMRIVFQNIFKPYYSVADDLKIAFKNAVMTSLDNMYELLVGHKPAANQFQTTWELGSYIAGLPMDGNNNHAFIISKFMEIYTYNGYSEQFEDAEFIARYPEILSGVYADSEIKIIEPIKDFYNNHIQPYMSLYLDNFEVAC